MRMAARRSTPCQCPQVLVDTSVWLDFFTDRAGTAQRIAAILEAIERGGGVILTALPTMIDLFYLVPAYLESELAARGQTAVPSSTKAVAWSCLHMLRERSVIVGADVGDCLEAEFLRQLHDDFGDDLILAAAKRGKADYLLTERASLRQHAPMAALDTAEMCALLGIEGDMA